MSITILLAAALIIGTNMAATLYSEKYNSNL